MIRRRAIALAVASLAVFAGQAVAEQKKFPTRMTISIKREPEQDVIKGKVRSEAHACEANRKVKLRHRSIKEDEKSNVVARLRTNGKGKWRFRAKANPNGDHYATPGYYHAQTGEKRTSTGDGPIVCKDRKSETLFVG